MTRRRAPAGLLAVAVLVPAAFLAVFFAIPVAGMLRRGLTGEAGIDPAGLLEVLGRSRTRRVVSFTLWSSTAATLLTVLVGVPVAHALHRLTFRGRRVLRALVLVPFVLPTVVVGVMFRSLLAPTGALGGLGLDGSWVAILAALVFFNIAVVVRTVGGAWESLDPRAEQSAAALGASPAAVFRTVTLPALAPSIVSAAVVVFLFCSTAFGVVLTLGGLRYGTVETEIYMLTTSLFDLRAAAALSILQLLATTTMLWLTGLLRRRTERVRGRPREDVVVRPTRAALPSLLVTAATLTFLATPIASLVVRSLQRDGRWTLANYVEVGRPVAGSVAGVSLWEAVGISWRTAVDATVLAMTLGVLVAFAVSRPARTRTGRRFSSALDAVVMLPLGVSAVTVGFGFLLTLDRPPLDLRSSAVLVPVAQAMVALPLVVRSLAPVLRSIDDRQRQAAAALGASPMRELLTVDLAAVRRPILAATGLALAVSLGEFGATSFLARPDRPTVPVLIYQLLGRPGADNFGMAMAACVVLAGLTVAVVAGVERLNVASAGVLS